MLGYGRLVLCSPLFCGMFRLHVQIALFRQFSALNKEKKVPVLPRGTVSNPQLKRQECIPNCLNLGFSAAVHLHVIIRLEICCNLLNTSFLVF